MKKRRIIVLVCAVITLLAGSTVCLFKFTSHGQLMLYNVFGGKDFHIVSGSKELYWFDVMHSNDPNSPMFNRIEDTLAVFNPDLVLVEGGADSFEGNRDEAIYDGESSFATFLAKENGITVEDIEPPVTKQIEYLQTKYSPDEILAMYLIRQIGSVALLPENTEYDFDANLLSDTQFFVENGLDYKNIDLDNILEVINTYLPQPINKDNWQSQGKNLYRVYSKDDGIILSVYNDVYNYRNIYLIELIKEKRELYNNIFIVMGGQHIIDTKEDIHKLYPQ